MQLNHINDYHVFIFYFLSVFTLAALKSCFSSNAPISGAFPEYGRPTFVPASIRTDLFERCKKLKSGKLPSFCRGPSTPFESKFKKSSDETVTGISKVL